MRLGETEGAKLPAKPASIPDYAQARGGLAVDAAGDQDLALWELLYEDSYYELQLLQAGDEEEMPAPNAVSPGTRVLDTLEQLEASEERERLLVDCGLDQVWGAAYQEVLESEELEESLEKLDYFRRYRHRFFKETTDFHGRVNTTLRTK